MPRVLRLPYRGFAAWAIWGVLPIDGNIADRERLAVLMDWARDHSFTGDPIRWMTKEQARWILGKVLMHVPGQGQG